MDNKISRDIHADSRRLGLTGHEAHVLIWAYIKANFCGMTSDDAALMEFECQQPAALLEKVMKKTGAVHTEHGWWLQHHIRKEFGLGESLMHNSMTASIFKELLSYGKKTQELILTQYPSLRSPFQKYLVAGVIEKPHKRKKPAQPDKSPESPAKVPLEQMPEADWDAPDTGPPEDEDQF